MKYYVMKWREMSGKWCNKNVSMRIKVLFINTYKIVVPKSINNV